LSGNSNGVDSLLRLLSMLCEHLLTSQVLRLVRKAVVVRLLVDEDLMVEAEAALGREQARRKDAATTRLDPDEEVGPAHGAEASLGPRRRVVNRNLVLALDAEVVTTAQREQRSSTPLPAEVAVAGSGIGSQVLRLDRHRPAKAASVGLDNTHACVTSPCW